MDTENRSLQTEKLPIQGWALFWGGLVVLALPQLYAYFMWLWGMEHYRFFPFAIVAMIGLALARWDHHLGGPRSIFAWGLIAVALAAIIGANRLQSPWLAMLGAILISFAFLASHRGPNDSSLVAAVLPIVVLLRMPLGYDQILVLNLQSITTRISSVLLDFVSVPHALQGNVIQLASRELFVAEACSGIQSVFTLLFVALLLVAFNRRRLSLLPLYLVVAIVLAVIGNVLRVSIIAASDYWSDFDLASGWPHEILGYLTLSIALVCLLSFDHLIVTFLHEAPALSGDASFNPIILGWNRVFGETGNVSESIHSETPAVKRLHDSLNAYLETFFSKRAVQGFATFLVLGWVTVSAGYFVEVNELAPGAFSDEITLVPSHDFFDDHFRSLSVREHEVSREGENARLGTNADVWKVSSEGLNGQLVLSQTYLGWHELCLCYSVDSWELLTRDLAEPNEGQGKSSGVSNDPQADTPSTIHPSPIVFARFRNEAKRGYLFYCGITTDGTIVNPPALPGRLGMRFGERAAVESIPMVMLQLWVVSDEAVKADWLNNVRKDFFIARNKVAEAIRVRTTSNSTPALLSTEE